MSNRGQFARFNKLAFLHVTWDTPPAVRLWQKHGFAIVGTLPGAFLHQVHGYVDAYVMFKTLALGGESPLLAR
jgi:ribosomal protein S18 acetylase RimI-like enzyme